MKANHNQSQILSNHQTVVLNINKSKNESKSQLFSSLYTPQPVVLNINKSKNESKSQPSPGAFRSNKRCAKYQ